MAASNEMLTATFLFRLFACSRCRYPPLRVARSILIALPQEMGGASGNYIRTIFSFSPCYFWPHPPNVNSSVKYFE